jgi:hypothetical protein
MLTSRERVELALNHREPDRVPVDLGGCGQTGLHVSTVHKLRQALGLNAPGTPVKVIEPYQMLGEIQPDLAEAVGSDVVGMGGPYTLFGFKNENWKPWMFHDGTPLLVPESFNTDPEPNGDLYMYAAGDKSYPPSGRMPAGGWYFDGVIRQGEIDDDHLNVDDNTEEFKPLTDDELHHFAVEAEQLYDETDKAILMVIPGAGLGDIALVPGLNLKQPKGIRDVAEWYISTVMRREYVRAVFERQCQVVLNLPKIYEAVGESRIGGVISGTDLTQKVYLALNSHDLYFYKHQRLIRAHGMEAVHPLRVDHAAYPLFIEAGFRFSTRCKRGAANMDPATLKARFGGQATFWAEASIHRPRSVRDSG